MMDDSDDVFTMADGYDRMGHDELVTRARDWRRVAHDRSKRILELEQAAIDVEAERDALRAVVRKMVAVAGIAIDGPEGEWMSYACDEYAGRHEFTTEEQAAYQRAVDGSAEATDG